VIAAYGGPRDKGTASIKLMHYQGDMEGQGPVWGYVKGGMGMVSFAIADAAADAGAVLACGVPVAQILPGQGVVLEDGTRIAARTVVCNADPKVALRLLAGQDVPADYRASGGVEGPQPGGEVQRRAARAAAVGRRPRRALARVRDDRPHGRPRRGAAGVRGLRPRRAGRRLRRDLPADGLRPLAGAGGLPSAQRVRAVRALHAGGGHLGQPPRRRSSR
jgi:hypothetical protein